MSVDESAVLKGLDRLRQKGLALETQTSGSRVPKYLHEIFSRFDLSRPETAILCELMLRGPQTPGELRSNAGRMSPFGNIGEIEEALLGMIEHDPPLVAKLPREAGRKESRFSQLFAPDIEGNTVPDQHAAPAGSGESANEAISRLQEDVAQIKRELEELRQDFARFRSQF